MNTQGSFWTAFGVRFGQQQSSVDELLERDPVSIEEVLGHDDVIQECKYMNSALIEYLSKKETLEKLIRYIITVPDAAPAPAAAATATAADAKTAPNAASAAAAIAGAAAGDGAAKKDDDATAAAAEKEKEVVGPPRLNRSGNPRFPYVASELFACEVVSMLEGLFAHPELLDLLLSFLERAPPLNPASAGYFRKVVVVLIQRKHSQLVRHIQQKHLIDNFVNHIGLYSIMELLIMIGWDDGLGQLNDVTWLYNENLIPKLIAKLNPKFELESEVHVNAARALVDIVVKCPTNKPSMLVAHMKTQAVLDTLFTYLFSGNASSFTNCLSVVIVLVQSTANLRNEMLKLDDKPATDAAAKPDGDDKPATDADAKSAPAAGAADAKSTTAADGKTAAGAAGAAASTEVIDDGGEDWTVVTPIIQLLYKHLPALCEMAIKSPVGFFLLSNELAEVKTQFGTLKPPLGETRLKLVELFLVACRCNYKRLNTLLAKLHVIPFVMDLFYQYEWNNMLHGLVENLVQTITESEADVLKRSLFFDSKFIERIVEAHKKNQAIVSKPRGFRLGYMGHLLRMCNTLVQTIQKSAQTKALMTETGHYKDWETFVSVALADENKTSSIVLGGQRPQNPNAPQTNDPNGNGAGSNDADQASLLDAQSGYDPSGNGGDASGSGNASSIGNGKAGTDDSGYNFHDFDNDSGSGAGGGDEMDVSGAGNANSVSVGGAAAAGGKGFQSGPYDDDKDNGTGAGAGGEDDLDAFKPKWTDFSQFDEQNKKIKENAGGAGAGAAAAAKSSDSAAAATGSGAASPNAAALEKEFESFRSNAATNADANDSVQLGDAASASPAKPAVAAAAPAAAAATTSNDAAAPKTAATTKPDDWAEFPPSF